MIRPATASSCSSHTARDNVPPNSDNARQGPPLSHWTLNSFVSAGGSRPVSHIDSGTSRLRVGVIGPVATNNLDRPSLRSGTAVPSLNTIKREGMTMTIVEAARSVTGGVDTHLDVHVAAALDPLGALLGTERSPLTLLATRRCSLARELRPVAQGRRRGHRLLWRRPGPLSAPADVEVIEVDRPNRAERRRSGKSDPLDAVEAARAALGGRAKSISKSKDGAIEAIRVLVVAKRSARRARIKAITPDAPTRDHRPGPTACSPEGSNVYRAGQRGGRIPPISIGRCSDGCPQGGPVLAGPTDARARRRAGRARAANRGARRSRCTRTLRLASGSGLTPPPPSWSVPATTPSVCTQKPPGPICAVWPRSRPRRARATGTASIRVGTVRPTSALWRIVMVRIAHDPAPRPTSSAR